MSLTMEYCPECCAPTAHKFELGTMVDGRPIKKGECLSCGLKRPLTLTHKEPAETVLHFGKHSGKPLKEIPKDYLNWILENMPELRPTLKKKIIAHLKTL